MLGTVLTFNRRHGWGWLHCDDDGPDAWVWHEDIENRRYLVPGETAQFTVTEEDGRRRRATKVWTEREGKDDEEL